VKLNKPTIFALGAITALILGGGVGYAATGGNFILGHINQAGVVSTLSNPNGVALQLNSKSGIPSLGVNRTNRVPNLNADLFDGFDSTALALRVGKTGLIFGSADDADGFPFTAHCPSGTIGTGGGGGIVTDGDHLTYSGPDFNSDTGALFPNSWLALSDSGTVAWVVCYNPRGAVPGAATNISGASAASTANLRAARAAQARLATGSKRSTP